MKRVMNTQEMITPEIKESFNIQNLNIIDIDSIYTSVDIPKGIRLHCFLIDTYS